jgi:hypothetical protein
MLKPGRSFSAMIVLASNGRDISVRLCASLNEVEIIHRWSIEIQTCVTVSKSTARCNHSQTHTCPILHKKKNMATTLEEFVESE